MPPVETFDQRFRRLTGDMLMLDVCQILGIEVRELMKIRSGTRVKLSMDRLRKLCLEQGLDFQNFVRDYSEPWSSELRLTETVKSDEALPRRPTISAAAPSSRKADTAMFRPDGSRIASPVHAGTPAVPIFTEPPANRSAQTPTIHEENIETASPVQTREKTSPATTLATTPPRVNLSPVGRIRAALAAAAAALPRPEYFFDSANPNPKENIFENSIEKTIYREPQKIAGTVTLHGTDEPLNPKKIETILAEVSDLRRELRQVAQSVDRLLSR